MSQLSTCHLLVEKGQRLAVGIDSVHDLGPHGRGALQERRARRHGEVGRERGLDDVAEIDEAHDPPWIRHRIDEHVPEFMSLWSTWRRSSGMTSLSWPPRTHRETRRCSRPPDNRASPRAWDAAAEAGRDPRASGAPPRDGENRAAPAQASPPCSAQAARSVRVRGANCSIIPGSHESMRATRSWPASSVIVVSALALPV
jgi:hypothetical protein